MSGSIAAGEFEPGGGGPGRWDPKAHVARFLAAVDAGLLEVPAEDAGWRGCWVTLAETDDPAVLNPEAFTEGSGRPAGRAGAIQLAAIAEYAGWHRAGS